MKRTQFLKTLIPIGLGTLALNKAMARRPDDVLRQTKIPVYLKPGDTIAITCPAGPMDKASLQKCADQFAAWGFKIKYGDTVGKKWQRFGGTDAQRTADFQNLLNDNSVDAIVFGRGGYGAMRMMDGIDWTQFVKKPKWLVGFSDITAFHCHINTNYGIATLHADMGNGYNGTVDDAAKTFFDSICGKLIDYKAEGNNLNRKGNAQGILVGGNLSLIYAMQASKSELKTDGKILLVEDVSEYKYTVDRMMMNLKRSGKLEKLAGIIFGGFTATKADQEDEFPMSMEELLWDKVKEYNYPVCFGFPAGHLRQNLALKLGVPYQLNVQKTSVSLKEINKTFSVIEQPVIDTSIIATDSLKNN
jgi:muramoyltetrapeptide carboxypeptidase